MNADTGLSKEDEEEEDDTMQNTVVLFSSTDKFVLLQVKYGIFCYLEHVQVTLGSQFHKAFFLCFLGHVCCMWQFRARCRGPAASLCSVLPVLPSILCKQQGKHVMTGVIFSCSLCSCGDFISFGFSTPSVDHKDDAKKRLALS